MSEHSPATDPDDMHEKVLSSTHERLNSIRSNAQEHFDSISDESIPKADLLLQSFDGNKDGSVSWNVDDIQRVGKVVAKGDRSDETSAKTSAKREINKGQLKVVDDTSKNAQGSSKASKSNRVHPH